MSLVPRIRSPRHRQSGQALAEVVVLALLLVPLLLLLPTLGKYMHGKQMMQQATRSAVWEATVAGDYEVRASMQSAALRERIVQRHFSGADVPIQTRPEAAEADDPLGNPMFNTFSDQPLLEHADIVMADATFESTPGFVSRVVEALPSWLPGSFPPSDASGQVNGLVTGGLTLNFQNLRVADGSGALFLAPFDSINLQMSDEQALVADTWNARGSGVRGSMSAGHHRSTYDQVQTLVPGTLAAPIDNALERISGFTRWVPVVGVIDRLRFDIARDTMDVVPHDKLEAFTP